MKCKIASFLWGLVRKKQARYICPIVKTGNKLSVFSFQDSTAVAKLRQLKMPTQLVGLARALVQISISKYVDLGKIPCAAFFLFLGRVIYVALCGVI